MIKRRGGYMELFKRLRRAQQEIKEEQQEIRQAYLNPVPVKSMSPRKLNPRPTRRRTKKVKSPRSSGSPRKKSILLTKKKPLRSFPQKTLPHRHFENSKKKGVSKEEDLLKDALTDLDRELRSLRASRRQLELLMEDVSGKLGYTQEREIALRNKISELMKQETVLEGKKSSCKDKLNNVLKRIEKVRTIETQLKEV